MRIVLDLGRMASDAALRRVDIARRALREHPGHEVWVAFCREHAGQSDRIRGACGDFVPDERVVAYELPALAGPWGCRAEPPVRAYFMAGLGADLVLDLCSNDDEGALAAQIDAAGEARHAAGPARAMGDTARPRLALVSPLPPVRSGVAFHAADLVPHLARFYSIELVTPQPAVEDSRLRGLPVRSLEWFEAHAHEFDRIVYQFGNSAAHEHMFGLIRRYPGVAVLHDLFLSNTLDDAERSGKHPRALSRALYESHGWGALLDLHQRGRPDAVWKYPASRGVLASAAVVIVHSEHARRLATQWYGPDLGNRCTVVPLLRHFEHVPGRAEARARLGLGAGDFLVCSFGLLGATKRNQELVDAFRASPLAADKHCRLVFVGENVPTAYGLALTRKIRASASAAPIAVTGFVPPAEYAAWLAASDLAVQLRGNSRGETSAAVLDCMAHGVPTIVNAHGSSAEIDGSCVFKIPDDFAIDTLALALQRLRADEALRRELAARSRACVSAQHTAGAVARRYFDCIEQAANEGPAARYRSLLRTLGSIGVAPSPADLGDAARAIAFDQPPVAPRQLLVDVSAVVKVDLGTGIQRVVRHILLEWFKAPPEGYRVEPVYSPGDGRPYRYARRFGASFAGLPNLGFEDSVAELRRGDVFLGLDLVTAIVAENESLLLDMRDRGVHVFFTIFDLLPVQMPDAFPPGTEKYFANWLRTISSVSDGIVCISRAVADQFSGWIARNPPRRHTAVGIGYFHLGADLLPRAADRRFSFGTRRALRRLAARPSLLMVGTLEPRKGHDQALAAAQLLWARGVDFNLVIVGKAGWMMGELVGKIKKHPELERRLYWFGHASDALLLGLYDRCSALLAASRGEGFGLPLIEAAQKGLPIIARDIPVFREVGADHAYYFSGDDPEALAVAIERWLVLRASGQHPNPAGLHSLTWSRSARELAEVVLGGRRWLTAWHPPLQPAGRDTQASEPVRE